MNNEKIQKQKNLQKKLIQDQKEENKRLDAIYKKLKESSVYHTTGEMVPLSLVRKTKKTAEKIMKLGQRIEATKRKIAILALSK